MVSVIRARADRWAVFAAVVTAFFLSAQAALGGSYWPEDIVATADGRVWFINGDGAVGVFDPLTGGITQHVMRVHTQDAPRIATDLAVAENQVWVATDKGVARLAADGSFREYALASGADAIAAGSDGALWVTLRDAHAIARVTPDGQRAIWLAQPYHSYLDTIALGPEGDIWYVDSGDILARLDGGGPQTWPRLGRITARGEQEEWTLAGGSERTPWDLVSGPDGALWAALAAGDRIARITRTTGGLRAKIVPTPVGLRHPDSIVVGPDRALWFVGQQDGAVGRVTTAGDFTAYPLTEGAGGVDPSPDSLAFAPDGALWFTEDGRDLIVRMTGTGELREYSIPFLSASAMQLPPGVSPPSIPSAVEESLRQPE